MRAFALSLVLACATLAAAQAPKAPATPPTLKSTLLDQLRATHNKEEWYVPVNIADAGLTPEQARWIPTSLTPNPAPADHSVGMLTYHLLYWNAEVLAKMKGEKPSPSPADNRDTFNKFDASNWPSTAAKLDAVLTEMENLLANASDAQLAQWASSIQHVSAHNAYHIGQMIEIRKLQGSWDPAKGVK